MSSIDKFEHRSENMSDPVSNMVAITPADTDLANITRAIYIGTTGDLVVESANGNTVTFTAVPAGMVLPIRVRQIKAATTASNIVSLY